MQVITETTKLLFNGTAVALIYFGAAMLLLYFVALLIYINSQLMMPGLVIVYNRIKTNTQITMRDSFALVGTLFGASNLYGLFHFIVNYPEP